MAILTPNDARRRWFGVLFLILGALLLIWGATFLNAFLMRHPFLFVAYWAACALLTGCALLTALLDMLIIRKRTRDEQIALARQSLAEIDQAKNKDPLP